MQPTESVATVKNWIAAARRIFILTCAGADMCWRCGLRGPMQEALERVRGGEVDPPCRACGGILKSDTISFGQALVPEVIERAMAAAAASDLLLAVGSTLQVYPVAGVVPLAKQSGARIVIVNNQSTPMDDLADALFRAPIGEVLPALCAPATGGAAS